MNFIVETAFDADQNKKVDILRAISTDALGIRDLSGINHFMQLTGEKVIFIIIDRRVKNDTSPSGRDNRTNGKFDTQIDDKKE